VRRRNLRGLPKVSPRSAFGTAGRNPRSQGVVRRRLLRGRRVRRGPGTKSSTSLIARTPGGPLGISGGGLQYKTFQSLPREWTTGYDSRVEKHPSRPVFMRLRSVLCRFTGLYGKRENLLSLRLRSVRSGVRISPGAPDRYSRQRSLPIDIFRTSRGGTPLFMDQTSMCLPPNLPIMAQHLHTAYRYRRGFARFLDLLP
jgi:hypothetical protein